MGKVEVGVLSELYERCLGVKSPTGAKSDSHVFGKE